MNYALHRDIVTSNPLIYVGKEFDSPKVQHMKTIRPEELKEFLTALQTAQFERGEAQYHDTRENRDKTVTLGSDTRETFKTQGNWSTEEEARRALAYQFNRANKDRTKGTISILGKVIIAGSILTLNKEQYSCKSVRHSITNSGWLTDIELEGTNRDDI